jgi:hypothetical protein
MGSLHYRGESEGRDYNAPPEDGENAAYRRLAVCVLTRALLDANVVYGKAGQVENSQTRQQAYGYPNGFSYFICDPDTIRFWCIVAGVPVDKFHRALGAIALGNLDPKKVKRLRIDIDSANHRGCYGTAKKAEEAFNDYIQQAYQ